MKLSRIPFDSNRERVNSDELMSQQILFQAGLLKRFGSGLYGKNNLLVKAHANIENVIRTVLEKHDCVEVSLPILQPSSIWESSGRWDTYVSSGQMLCTKTQNGTFALAPTAEEAAVFFAQNSLRSYKNLPINIFQIGYKFRNELRARGGLLRSKEFTMMDSYSFSASYEDMEAEYANMKNAYLEIFSTLGLEVVPVSAMNGDMGGKISEEFMFICETGEDTVLVNDDYSIALNTEILEMENSEEYLKDNFGIEDISTLHEEHCIELGHIFQLGQKYSESMNATFVDENNNEIPFFMGCYGIGVSRTLAAILEKECDDEGICWPDNIAPYNVEVIYTFDRENEAMELYDYLQANGVSVLIDDRNSITRLGPKIHDWKLLGIPHLIVVGKSWDGITFVVEDRKDGTKHNLSRKELIDFFC